MIQFICGLIVGLVICPLIYLYFGPSALDFNLSKFTVIYVGIHVVMVFIYLVLGSSLLRESSNREIQRFIITKERLIVCLFLWPFTFLTFTILDRAKKLSKKYITHC